MSLTIPSPLVEADWLENHLGDPSLRILDCAMVMQTREDGSIAFASGEPTWQESHIPGSAYISTGEELSDRTSSLNMMMPVPEQLAEAFLKRGIGDGTAVVFYDRGNHAWAARVWWLLRACGFDNAAVLNGGWRKWQAEKRPASSETTSWPVPETFTINPRPQLMVDKARVKTASEAQDAVLIHSLPLPLFTGEKVAYARPGRIPGSKHLYCESLLDTDTFAYHDIDTLKARITGAGISKDDTVITYCGGGIAASANALALTAAGFEDVAVYDGSLSEWTADPDLPMETG